MAITIEDLIARLAGHSYTPLTQQQIDAQAQARYQTVYDEKRLAAQQAYQSSDDALARELQSLQAAYDRERAQSEAGYRSAYAQADRQALGRGMQRSSYNGATLAGIALAGQAAQQDIALRQAQQESDIAGQRTLLGTQLAQQLQQYDNSMHADARAYADELSAREYDRQTAARGAQDSLALQIYEYQRELQQAALEQERWLAEFNAKYGGGGGGGGGRSGRRSGGRSSAEKDEEAAAAAAAVGSIGAAVGGAVAAGAKRR